MTLSTNKEQDTHAVLTDKIKQLKELNHMIAHNLRGSAANIKMFADILIEKNLDDTNNADDNVFTTAEAVQYIQESSVSLLYTLSSLMAITDIELNEKLKYSKCDINEIIEHIISQLSGIAHQKNAIIERDLAIPIISYPMHYMESILYNIISNGLKYSKPTGQININIATYIWDGKVVLSVKDNGVGIDLKKYGRKIFNLYQVFHHGYESKGMGLYIIKKQIESLGGSISVKSKVDKGSEFIVVL